MGSVFDPESRMEPFGWGTPYGHGSNPDPDPGPLESHRRVWEARAAGSCLARFGNVESIDFCNPCMVGVLGGLVPEGGSMAVGVAAFGKDQIIGWLQDVAKQLQRIPSQSFPSIEEFRAADRDE